MVNRIIAEIKSALEHDCYIVALMSALTLPDICGKAAYPNLGVGARYKKWCDTYVYPKRENDSPDANDHDSGITNVNGKIIYELRCCLLHQGSSDIDGEKCEVEDFELVIQPQNEFEIYVDNIGVIWSNDDFDNRQRHMSLQIRNICRNLCDAAEIYYNAHKEEFGFINCKVVEIHPDAEQPWDYKTKVSL